MYRLLLALVLCCGFAVAQDNRPPGDVNNNRMRPDSAQSKMPAIGQVIGVLRDSVSREPLEFASVALIRLRDTTAVGGSLTDVKGHFNITEIQPGKYKLRVTSIGYKNYDTAPFNITMQESTKDVGILLMPPNLKVLKEVNITEEKQEYVNTLDKKVFNVEKNLIATGGTVSDVLQNVPSVSVDIDGNVSLRGSENVTILIDGKPSGLTAENRANLLRQIPASSIDQIEVITNPGARYDAEGMSGIINIKTKKDKRQGFNGTATAGVGTRDKYNGSINLNRRTKNFNFYGNYGFRREDRFNEGSGDRTNLYDTTYIVQKNDGLSRNISHNIKAGTDWSINEYNVLGISGGLNLRDEERKDNSQTLELDEFKVPYSGFTRYVRIPQDDGQTIDGAVDYKKTFPGTKRELSGNVNLSTNTRSSEEKYFTYPVTGEFVNDQRQISERDNFNYGGQLDYIHPTTKIRYEGGVKLTVRDNTTAQKLELYDPDKLIWNVNPLTVDKFEYRDEVYAGYVQAGGKIGVIETQAGLRTEYTKMIGTSADTSFDRDFIDPFPSLTFRYNVKKDQDIQLAYSRRITRPDGRQLNPFVNYSDSLNLQRGNPGIDPEYVHSLELGYMARFKEQNVSFTLYHRYVDNFIQRYRTIDPNTGITMMTFVNFKNARNSGVEVVLRNTLYKGITLNTTFNGFYNQVDATNIEEGLTSDAFAWDIRATLNAKVLKSTSLQVTGNYMAPRKNPQGTFKGMQGVDVGVRHDFKGGKWSLNLAVSDIFNKRRFEVENNTSLFTSNTLRKRESRVGTLTLTYNFGSSEGNNLFKKRQNNRQDQTSPDMMDF